MTQPAPPIPAYAAPPGTPTTPAPLTPEQLATAKLAHDRSRKIRRAASVAFTDASITAFFAFVSLVFCIFDYSGIWITGALLVVAWNSFRGAGRLKRFDSTAPRLLALNQIFLAFCIILYAAIALWQIYAGSSQMVTLFAGDKASAASLREAGVDLNAIINLVKNALYIGYSALIVGTLLAQGLTAWYYWSRKALLETYLAQTPAWVIDLQKHQSTR